MPSASNLVRWFVTSIADRGRTFLNDPSRSSTEKLCQDLVSERGEASTTALANEILYRYDHFSEPERLQFFQRLLGPSWLADPKEILRLAQEYHKNPTAMELAKLFPAVEPRRQELFRRINITHNGTQAIVKMRKDLLALLREHRELEPINVDLIHLLSSWFNRGFLELRRIDWRTPALILEKLIEYESVHQIQGWTDLRRRLERDRRCFAFFHPALPDEPLIFVEVAFTQGMAGSIQPLIDVNSEPADPSRADTAIFYSINNCLEGLRQVSFGASLIKRVVDALQAEAPGLRHFVTLSPIPKFRDWLMAHTASLNELPNLTPAAIASLGKVIAGKNGSKAVSDSEAVHTALLRACAAYLTTRRKDGRALDPVAAFHLSNGASIERINWVGDASEKGMKQAFGLMVNYAYRPARIEKNHEQYTKHGKFAMSHEVQALLLDQPAAPKSK